MNIKSKKICAFGIWLFFIFGADTGLCRTEHDFYFENTEYELNIYKIYGAENGKTLMIIGGIQGDEPGGYLSADLYADMALRRGKLIVVPRANFFSIIEHKRAINRDMNRRFTPVNSKEFYEDKIVEILKGLIASDNAGPAHRAARGKTSRSRGRRGVRGVHAAGGSKTPRTNRNARATAQASTA